MFVHAVLDADACIVLGEDGGGDAYEAHAAMDECGREAGAVEHAAAADGEDVALAAEAGVADGVHDLLDLSPAAFGGFTAGDDLGREEEVEGVGLGGEPRGDVGYERGVGKGGTVVDKGEDFGGLAFDRRGEEFTQGGVAGGEEVVAEPDGVGVGDGELLLDDVVHALIQSRTWPASSRSVSAWAWKPLTAA